MYIRTSSSHTNETCMRCLLFHRLIQELVSSDIYNLLAITVLKELVSVIAVLNATALQSRVKYLSHGSNISMHVSCSFSPSGTSLQ